MLAEKGYVDPELLRTLGELLNRTKQLSYELMQLQSTSKVLDVGCGSGIDTISLGKLIGVKGEVVGVDFDENMIAQANDNAVNSDLNTIIKHVVADASHLPFESNYFDSCRSERLFQHMMNYETALSEMVRVTKPNGHIVVLDTDWGTISIDTQEIDLERRITRILSDSVFNNGYSGRKLFRQFKQQHLLDITIELFPTYVTNYNLLRQILLLERAEAEALKTELITQVELERWHLSLEQADSEGTCFGSGTLVMIVGRKPH